MTRPSLKALIVFALVVASHGSWAVCRATDAADAEAAAGAETEDRSVSELLEAGGRHLGAGDLDAAGRAFERARLLDPSSPLPLMGLADVAERRGHMLDALSLARRAQPLIPDSDLDLRAALLERLSRWLIRLGAPSEALKSLEQWRSIAPENPASYGLSAMVLRDIDRAPQAIDLLRPAIARPVPSPALSEQLGLLLLSEGDAGAALDSAERALESFPDQPGLELVKGLALAANPASRADALPWLERALEHGAPDPGRIHLEIGSILADGECRPRAARHFELAAELRPHDPQAHYQLGTAHRACGRAQEARVAFAEFQRLSTADDARDHQRKQIGAALNDAQRLAAAGTLDDALSALDSLADAHPTDDRIFTLRAKVLLSAKRLDAAIADAQRARTLMPSRLEAHYLEGLALAQSGQLVEAKAALERALAIDEAQAEVHQLLAAVVAESGSPGDAVHHFERAIELGSDTPSVRLAFARVLASLGRDDESAAQMNRYRELTGG